MTSRLDGSHPLYNAGMLLIGPLGTNLSENLIRIQTFSFKKIRFKMSSARRHPFFLGLNVLILSYTYMHSFLVKFQLPPFLSDAYYNEYAKITLHWKKWLKYFEHQYSQAGSDVSFWSSIYGWNSYNVWIIRDIVHCYMQWSLSLMTTSMIKFIICDLFSNVF